MKLHKKFQVGSLINFKNNLDGLEHSLPAEVIISKRERTSPVCKIAKGILGASVTFGITGGR